MFEVSYTHTRNQLFSWWGLNVENFSNVYTIFTLTVYLLPLELLSSVYESDTFSKKNNIKQLQIKCLKHRSIIVVRFYVILFTMYLRMSFNIFRTLQLSTSKHGSPISVTQMLVMPSYIKITTCLSLCYGVNNNKKAVMRLAFLQEVICILNLFVFDVNLC